MNIVNKLTVKHLKKNKRRTLITMIGVIISVAMTTATITLAISMVEMFQKNTRNYTGDWQVAYQQVPVKNIPIIEQDHNTAHLIIENELGFAKLVNQKEQVRPYLYLTAVNQESFNDLPFTLTSGELPQTPQEMVVSDQLKGVAIGDQLTLAMGKRVSIADENNGEELANDLYEPYQEKEETFIQDEVKTYTITGFINTERISQSSAADMAYSVIGPLTENKQVNVKVELKKINRSLYQDSRLLSEAIDSSEVTYNQELLRFYGVTDNKEVQVTLLTLMVIVGLIILIGSVVLIYNAFMISLGERSRHLGMLASIGATKRQKRNSVFFEGLIVGSIAIPIGLMMGIVGIALSLQVVSPLIKNIFDSTEDIHVVLSPLALIGVVIFSSLIILLSTWMPALKASRISPIDGIRQTKYLPVKNKSVRTSKWVRKVFGFEAELGLKNIKRNRQRYLATLFSMILSIVLFLSTVTFTHVLSSSFDMSYENTKADIAVMFFNDQTTTDTIEPDIKSYEQIDRIDKVTQVDSYVVTTKLTKEALNPKISTHYSDGNGSYQVGVNLMSVDDQTMEEIYQAAHIDQAAFESQEMGGILFNRVSYHHEASYEVLNISNLKAEDEVLLYSYDQGAEQEKVSDSITLSQVSDYQLPFMSYIQEFPELTIVVSKPTMEKIRKKQEAEGMYAGFSNIYIQTEDASFVEEKINDIMLDYPDANGHVYNIKASKQKEEAIHFLIAFFIYSFIGLMTLIGLVSVFNTLTTNIQLRKQEFAMLKSVGLTPQGFNKMIRFESLFYGLKALLYGLPISFLIMYLLYQVMMPQFNGGFYIPWGSIAGVILTVFVLTSGLMYYSTKKMKMASIVEAMKNEML
ncbi:ABC transporter permease [Isobaculum melis]|uniref:Putative ABC transport system permease protein n=1 Tax=Isobaculum melis TaxID=142588 RepID=A0A1H9PZF2_9LACT|nr:ABC transporter permease [Isobaculum melis]SER53597.1 putative ABC transport system permease protein [Isobaculum melis]